MRPAFLRPRSAMQPSRAAPSAQCPPTGRLTVPPPRTTLGWPPRSPYRPLPGDHWRPRQEILEAAADPDDDFTSRGLTLCDALPTDLYLSPAAFLPLDLVRDAYHAGCVMCYYEPNPVLWHPTEDAFRDSHVRDVSRRWLRALRAFVATIPAFAVFARGLDHDLLTAMLDLVTALPRRTRRG